MSLRDDYVKLLEQENDEMRERVRQLEQICGISFEVPPAMGLSRQQSVLLGLLLKNRLVTKTAVMTALYGASVGEIPEEKIVDVFICQLRRKLTPFGVGIETQWGQGWYMTAEHKASCAKLLAQVNAA